MASSVTESKTTWSVGFSHAARPPDDGYTLTRFKRTDACTTDEGFTIIFLHGAGDGDGVNAWTNIWRSLLQNLPANCEVMLPSGPFVPPPQNAEGDPTLGWIRLQRWRGIGHNSNYRVPKEALQGLDDVAHQISQLVKSEGAHGRKVILGGFSQGGAVSVYAGLTTDCWPHIAGLFCLSGYVLLLHASPVGSSLVVAQPSFASSNDELMWVVSGADVHLHTVRLAAWYILMLVIIRQQYRKRDAEVGRRTWPSRQ
eukprot:TRINITY_DN3365_c0_g1_i4.p1 TRINITY_DN3365_c0_g1~~TRINITY_DN3365_c0_g1_i4.p1  ORF type:complete len:255 (+),score=15.91 TRINITY_DN3365_c0_g1_i4:54-818(+)